MLPLALLSAAQGKPMLVELKNGVTFNGHLVDCDHFMNVTLREVYQTSADGEKFWKMKEMFIKGNVIKYFRIADSVLDQAAEEQKQLQMQRQRQGNRGGRGGNMPGRGRGGPPRGGPPRGRGGPGGRGRGGHGGHQQHGPRAPAA